MSDEVRYWHPYGLSVVLEGPHGRMATSFNKPFARIGSDERPEIVLPRSVVGRQRLFLLVDEPGVFLVDLAWCEIPEACRRGWIRPDQPIQIGPYKIFASAISFDPAFSVKRYKAVDVFEWDSAQPPWPVIEVSCDNKCLLHGALRRRLTLVSSYHYRDS